MKKILIFSLLCFVFIGCADSASKVSVQTAGNNNANVAAQQTNETLTIPSHSSDSQTAASANPKDASTQNGSPMAKAVNVSEMSADIEKAKKEFEQNSTNDSAKQKLAKAYFVRAFALTEAAQYRAALGDFRKGLKLDPNDAEAKKMHDEIIRIFKSINREPPKEGEEPAPLPIEGEETSANQTNSGERINFKNSATQAIANGDLKNYGDSKTFVIEVKNGQTLRTEQVKPDKSLEYVTVEITDPNGEQVGDHDASCNNRKIIKPTVAGNYKIKVFECRKADAWSGKFDLKVSVV